MQKRNRILRLFMVLILTISTVTIGLLPVSVAAASFTDVSDDAYYAEAVAWAVENNITKGTTDTTFSPNNGCTRAQVVTFLWRAAGQPDATKTSDFSDVAKDEYYTKAVSWAVENEITKGVGNNQFAPNNTCTRAQVVTFLMRCSNLKTDVDLGPVNIGEYVTFGHYEQDNNLDNGKEPIEWKVLDKKDGRALLISKYGLDCKRYNETNTHVTWETCTLRSWLNSDFLKEAFSSSEKSAIPTVILSNPDNPSYGTEGGNDTQDQVFLLSLQEMQQYFDLSYTWTDIDGNYHDLTGYKDTIGGSKEVFILSTAYAKAQKGYRYDYEPEYDSEGKKADMWWLRSPGYSRRHATFVHKESGAVTTFGNYVDYSLYVVRPALWVNLAS